VCAVTADTVRLLGSDSTVLGEVATADVGGRAGVALSRGRFPKPDVWVDPNEDAVLAAHDGDRWLLVAVDGHLGFDAARAAMSAIGTVAPETLADDRDGRVVVAAIIDYARESVVEALSATDEARRRSRTAVSVVLVRPGEAFAATCGDSSVFRVREGNVQALTPATRFLGPRTPPPPVVRARLRPGDGLAAVTDGFTDFLGRAVEPTLCRELRGKTPAQAAHALVLAAFAGGAGDNVGVAVLLSEGPARGHWGRSAR
jgi:serine/threonine protein phosphatase PrpC